MNVSKLIDRTASVAPMRHRSARAAATGNTRCAFVYLAQNAELSVRHDTPGRTCHRIYPRDEDVSLPG